MELKEYLLIIKKQLKLFSVIIFLVITGTLAYFIFRPVFFESSLLLNITRVGNQISDGYKYDDFYRLQADEKFAETIVQWLKNPRIVTDINSEAGRNVGNLNLKQLTKFFQADKLSSQVVSVRFASSDKKTGEKMSQAVSKILRQNTEKLNEDQKESTWFEIKADDPVIIKNVPDYFSIFLVALFVGIFLAFWVVLIRHYLK